MGQNHWKTPGFGGFGRAGQGREKRGRRAGVFCRDPGLAFAIEGESRMKFVRFAGRFAGLLLSAALAFCGPALAQGPQKPRNIIIFVADGLRYGSVEPGNMPNLYRLKTEGVDFTNSHSLYPTITTVNASAIATGHYIGDTGDFGNTLYTGMRMDSQNGATVVGLENDAVLAEM